MAEHLNVTLLASRTVWSVGVVTKLGATVEINK